MTPPDIISTKPSPELASTFEMHILDATDVLVGEPVPSPIKAKLSPNMRQTVAPFRSQTKARNCRAVFAQCSPCRLASGFDMRLLAVLALGALVLAPLSEPASAQDAAPQAARGQEAQFRGALPARNHSPKAIRRPARASPRRKPEPKQPEQPSRPDFTADDQAARDHSGHSGRALLGRLRKGLPRSAARRRRGPGLRLSTGGGDGAFGAGLLNGWSESGKRPEFSVVTGVSTGALMAPYAFVGSSQDRRAEARLHRIQCGRHFRGREDAREPGRYLAVEAR